MHITSDFQMVVLEGTPLQRGRVHGETLRARITEGVGRWKDFIATNMKLDPDDYLDQFVTETHFQPAIQKWTPGLLDEVRGIAEGANIDFNTIYAWQLADEHWWHVTEKLNRAGTAESCSGLGIYDQPGSPNLIAQNMDIPLFYDGLQTLLHIKYPDSDLEALVFTAVGFIALNGLNNRGIGVCVNTLSQLDYSPYGLPVAFVIRGALERTDHEDAVDYICQVEHASGQNYIVGGPENVVDLEASAHQVSQFVPYTGANRVYHTNHPFVNDDQGMYQERLAELPPVAEGSLSNSEVRFNFLERELRNRTEPIQVETIQGILSSREAPVCVNREDNRGGFTAGCCIMALSDNPTLTIAPGPPSVTPFQTFSFHGGY